MKEQHYYDDTEVGTELPSLTKTQSLKGYVRWAQASNDLSEGHYNYKRAVARGLPDVFGQGALTAGYISQMVSDSCTPDGFVKKLSVQYRHYTNPGDVLTVKGVVTRKHRDNGENLVEYDVWAENQDGRKVTIGQAIVSMPSRDG